MVISRHFYMYGDEKREGGTIPLTSFYPEEGRDGDDDIPTPSFPTISRMPAGTVFPVLPES